MKIKMILLVLLLSARLWADEGMWLPFLLGEQVYQDMVKKGLKLSKNQLYDLNKASLKDAIIIFGGGCTGEIVSDKGLIFTNHHCGYDAIADASSMDHNYLRDGFYARSMAEEIRTPLTVQFLLRIDDVTDQIEKELMGLSGSVRLSKQQEIVGSLTASKADQSKGIVSRIYPMFKGNQFLMYTYQIFRDVRLVGTPPESIGKYGGDTDNWEWPRHTGDFSIFRVYMDKDGNPADYAADNVPFKPKHFLPVSLKGVKNGDFAMIYGYPGGTNRSESSFGVKLKTDISNPTLVKLRDMRLKYMFAEMQKDPATKLKLASNYASIANYWKFFDGESKQLLKFKTHENKQIYEQKFQSWANGKPEFENIFKDYAKIYESWTPYEKHRMYINEGIFGSPSLGFATRLISLENALNNGEQSNIDKAMNQISSIREAFSKENDLVSDENIVATVIKMYYQDVEKSQHPEGFFEKLSGQFGNLEDDATYKKMARHLFNQTILLDNKKWEEFSRNPSKEQLQNDPALIMAKSFLNNFNQRFTPKYQDFSAQNAELGRLYLKGIRQMNPVAAAKMYPDANFSMRVSYGSVQNYSPRDAVTYDYVCTTRGILEKFKPGDYEFDLPDYVLEAVKKKDFGQYIDKTRQDLVVTFITNNDITGGNSGSPVINGKGELIGLAFDGNYEALSHKIDFDEKLNRTICVDIRYVLWCIDKLGKATNIINELKLAR